MKCCIAGVLEHVSLALFCQWAPCFSHGPTAAKKKHYAENSLGKGKEVNVWKIRLLGHRELYASWSAKITTLKKK